MRKIKFDIILKYKFLGIFMRKIKVVCIAAIIIFLFYAKSVGMTWFVLVMILSGIISYSMSSFLDDINGR